MRTVVTRTAGILRDVRMHGIARRRPRAISKYGLAVIALACLTPLNAQWRTGYYSSNSFDGGLPASSIYYAPFTHIIHYNSFPVVSGSSVTLNTTYYGVAADAPTVIAGAHGAGVRVL